jgi:hypothetical protein
VAIADGVRAWRRHTSATEHGTEHQDTAAEPVDGNDRAARLAGLRWKANRSG